MFPDCGRGFESGALSFEEFTADVIQPYFGRLALRAVVHTNKQDTCKIHVTLRAKFFARLLVLVWREVNELLT
jgi:hypothetical protein